MIFNTFFSTYFSLLCCFILLSTGSQAQVVDSLQQCLQQSTTPTQKAVLYNAITWAAHEARQSNTLDLAETALSYAQAEQLAAPLITAQLQLAELLRRNRDLEQAKAYLAQAKTGLSNGTFPKKQVRAYFFEGLLLLSERKQASAIQLLETGLKASLTQAPDRSFDFCMLLAFLQQRQGNYEQASHYLNQGQQHAKTTTQQLKVYTSLGNLAAQQDNYSQALDWYQKVRQLADSSQNTLEASKALLNMGNIYQIEGNWKRAIELYINSAQLKKQLNDQLGLARIHNNIAAIYQEHARYDRSLAYYEKCATYYQSVQDSSELAATWVNIAVVKVEQEDYQLAITLLQQALSVLEARQLPQLILLAQLNLGATYLTLKEYDQASLYLNAAEQTASAQQDQDNLASITYLQGVLYFDLKQYQQALPYFEETLSLAQTLHLLKEEQQALEGLWETNKALGKAAVALDWHEQYVQIKDSLFDLATTNKIAELQEQYDSKQKEQAIQQLNITNKNISLENSLKTKQLSQSLLAILLAVVLLISLSMLWWYRNKQQRERLHHQQEIQEKYINQLMQQQEIQMLDAVVLAQQKERQGIAKEIHDTLGSYLATLKYQHEAGRPLVAEQTAALKTQYQRMEALIGQTATEVRHIAHQMATGEQFDFDLKTNIQQLVNRIQQTQQFELKFDYWGQNEKLPRAIEVTVYRLIQELLSNILKHAKASIAYLQLNQNEESLSLLLEDDGRGFNPEQLASKGLGLQNIKERIKTLNGQFEINSQVERGTSIVISIPI